MEEIHTYNGKTVMEKFRFFHCLLKGFMISEIPAIQFAGNNFKEMEHNLTNFKS